MEGGPNDGANRKQFVTRYVCRSHGDDGRWRDGTHTFELRWTLFQHVADGWTSVELRGATPVSLPTPESACPGD